MSDYSQWNYSHRVAERYINLIEFTLAERIKWFQSLLVLDHHHISTPRRLSWIPAIKKTAAVKSCCHQGYDGRNFPYMRQLTPTIHSGIRRDKSAPGGLERSWTQSSNTDESDVVGGDRGMESNIQIYCIPLVSSWKSYYSEVLTLSKSEK